MILDEEKNKLVNTSRSRRFFIYGAIFVSIVVLFTLAWQLSGKSGSHIPLCQSTEIPGELTVHSRIRYKHTRRHLPHCLIIGVRKAGTRALLEFLNLHDNIQAAKREEHFFDDNETYALGLEYYRRHMPFAFDDQITIEKTPAYFTRQFVPERVHQMNSSLRLLLIMRDPIERAVSDYAQVKENKVRKGKPWHTFEELAIDEDTGEVLETYPPIQRSIYHIYMANWLRYFDLSQFHFVDGGGLIRNPSRELFKVEEFLGLEHRLDSSRFRYNRTRGFYCALVEDEEMCLSESKGRAHPDIDPNVLQKLREYFKPHNEEFFAMIGKEFNWQ